MAETFYECLKVWKGYWGIGYFYWVLAAALVYLLICRRRKSEARLFLWFFAIFLIVFFCPVSAKPIFRCIGQDVYWRVLWVMPFLPAVVYAAVSAISHWKKPAVKMLLTICTVAIFAAAGRSIWGYADYQKTANRQKVPDEVAVIANMIREDAQEEPILLAADDYLSSYMRVYDASVQMPYGRRGSGAKTKRAAFLYYWITFTPETRHEAIAKTAVSLDCNYLVVTKINDLSLQIYADYGYSVIGEVEPYVIFSSKENE